MDKFKIGVAVVLDHAMKISGGISPKKDSEAKKIPRTPNLENVWVKPVSASLMLNT